MPANADPPPPIKSPGSRLVLSRLLLGPVLLAQGHRLKKTAMRLPEAEGERAGTSGEAQRGAPTRVLFLGDSSAAGVGVSHQREALAFQAATLLSEQLACPVHWHLLARSGVNTREALHMLRAAAVPPADVLVTALGTNDVTAQRSPGDFIRDYDALVAHAAHTTGTRAIVTTGLPPMHMLPAAPQPLRWYLGQYARALDARLRRWVAQRSDARYLSLEWAAVAEEMAVDSFHPGAGQYRHWAAQVARSIAVLVTGDGYQRSAAVCTGASQ